MTAIVPLCVDVPIENAQISSYSSFFIWFVKFISWMVLAAMIAAPIATADAGSIPLYGSFPKYSVNILFTNCILADPPTIIISLI